MKKAKWFVLLIVAWSSLAVATEISSYEQDKQDCTVHGNNLALLAEYRDKGMPRDELMSRVLGVAEKNQWPAEAVVGMLYQVLYAYQHSELTPQRMKEINYDACMRRRGHTET